MTIANETYSKIEGDIELRRRRSNRKDHFVFGLSQTSKYSDSSRFRNIDQIKAKFENYKDFLWKINFTNGLYAKSREEGEKTFKVFVGYGNNSPLIKGIMRRRYWWQLVDKISEDTNFVWTQLKSKEYYVLQISRGEPSQSKNQTLSMQGTNAITDSSNPQTEAIMSGFDL